MVYKDGTGINDGAVPPVVSTETNVKRMEKKNNIVTDTTELTNQNEIERKRWNGKVIKDGTGNIDGAVPLVVSTAKNHKRK